MKDEIISHFRDAFSDEPRLIIKAPGRINVIGEHLDYHLGYVMPAAIDQAIYLALSPTVEEPTKFYSVDHDDWYDASAESNPRWSGYVSTVFDIARENGLTFSPIQAVISADLPVGAGLSSSAALCCGLIYGLDHLFGWKLDLVEMAEFGQAVEHRLDVHCGIMDQYAVLHGKRDHVLKLDCKVNEHVYVPAQLQDYEFVLLHSGVSHALVESAYNDRRRVSEEGLRLIHAQYPQVTGYRDVTAEMVDRTHALSEEQIRLARYIVEEIARVVEASSCFEKRDVGRLGQLLLETHRGLQNKYQVTCEETDALVDLLVAHEEVLGARQMGGGFGGCVLVLIKRKMRDSIVARVRRQYQDKIGIAARLIPIALSKGIHVL